MWKFLLINCTLVGALVAQTGPSAIDVANLREDVRGLSQRVGDLALRVEQLERENTELRGRVGGADRNFVTLTQLNQSLDDLSRSLHAEIAASKNETLQRVASQIEKLGAQTNAALDSLAKAQGARPVAAPTFSEDYSKQGTTYTVQKGDTLARIVKKTGAREQDIINANRISDPSRIVVGQTLVIPNPPSSVSK